MPAASISAVVQKFTPLFPFVLLLTLLFSFFCIFAMSASVTVITPAASSALPSFAAGGGSSLFFSWAFFSQAESQKRAY